MADQILLGLFGNIEVTADVVDDLREIGIADEQVTIMSNVPFSEKLFGRQPARLWFLPFMLAGALGGALIGWFLTSVTPDLYPIHVGGQELTPLPPSAIIFFEFIAMGTMLASFIGFLIQGRFPILVREMYDPRITEGYIGVQVVASDGLADGVAGVFEKNAAYDVIREDAAAFKPQGIRHLFFWGGVATAGLGLLLIPLLLSYDVIEVPWVNTMKDTVVVQFQEGPRLAAPEEAVSMDGPLLIDNEPATAPLPATENSLARGDGLFSIYCSVCHGVTGGGDGIVSRNFPGQYVPALNDGNADRLSDADIFVIVTNGRGMMPSLAEQLDAGETWDIINYVRTLSPAAE